MRKILAIISLILSATASADMQLVGERSSLNFLSIKKGSVAEVHQFNTMSGVLADNGSATIEVSLTSVNTGIDVRNQRMRDLLFEVTDFPTASFTSEVDMALFAGLASGAEIAYQLEGRLSLHGIAIPLSLAVKVMRTDDGSLRVYTPAPLVLLTDDFGLAGGVEKLRQLAGLSGINPVVPVSFSVLFRQSGAN
jgi:polyisoprenoid-binding protein YceI